MVSHRSAPDSASRTLRIFGIAVVYALVLVTGTAGLMAAFAPSYDGGQTGPNGQRVTAAELVMQRSAERGLQAPETLLMAYRTIPNDKRGF